MARVVVTGGAGKLGRACVDELERHGWDVVAFDQVPPRSESGAVFIPIDLTDYGGVGRDAGRGGTVWSAGRTGPSRRCPCAGKGPDHLTFIHNISCTWNVVSAARRAEMTNIVWASSETVLGLPFDTAPPYIPVDEEPRPARVHLFAGQDPGRSDGRSSCAAGTRVEDDRAAVLERDGTRRLRTLSVLRGRPGFAEVEPVGLHRRPRHERSVGWSLI